MQDNIFVGNTSIFNQDQIKNMDSIDVVNISPERDFNHLTQLAMNICQTSIAAVTNIKNDGPSFTSAIGISHNDHTQTSLFCSEVIARDQILVISDTLEDLRFAKHLKNFIKPIRFFSGIPLTLSNGETAGILFVADYQPRQIGDIQLETLKLLAQQAIAHIELKQYKDALSMLFDERESINTALIRQSKLLNEAQRIAEVGSWDLQIDEKKLSWSNEIYRIFGRDIAEFDQTFENFLSVVHPEDCIALLQAQELALKQIKSLDYEHRIIRPNGEIRHVHEKGQLIFSELDEKLHFIGTLQDITEKKIVDEKLASVADRLNATLSSITDAFLTLDADGRFNYINKEAYLLLNGNRQDLIGKKVSDDFYSIFTSFAYSEFERARRDRCTVEFEEFNENLNKWFAIRVFPSKEGLGIYCQDISERKKIDIELVRVNRALQMLSACNESLLHATDELQLLSKVCKTAVEIGNYAGAWVGYTSGQNYNESSAVLQFISSDNSLSVDKLLLTNEKNSKKNIDPILQSYQQNSAICIDDLTCHDTETQTTAEAVAAGYKGMICLPLAYLTEKFGVLILYNNKVRQITESEQKLLNEMANDLAFGIRNIRIQNDRSRIQNAMMKVASSVSATSTNTFFEQLVMNMVDALGAYAGFVSRLSPNNGYEANTIINLVDGKVTDNFHYRIADIVCEPVTENESKVFSAKYINHHKDVTFLGGLKAETYIGSPLINSIGQSIGYIFVLFRESLKETDFIKSTLQIFATRVAAELERQEVDLRLREQASLLDKTQDAILALDMNHKIEFWSKGAEKLYGWKASEVVGSHIENVFLDDKNDLQNAFKALKSRQEWNGELRQQKKDGEHIIVEGRWTLISSDDHKPQAILGINTDITQKRLAADEIQQLAFYDALTQLPNRQLLRNRLQHLFTARARLKNAWALLFIDLDNFKTLNDTMGHDKGDMLLQEVAKRLSTCVRKSDTVARLGGDEFVILLESLGGMNQDIATQARLIGEKVLACFNEPFSLNGYPYYSSPSIGITLFDEDCQSADDLLKRADIAMYQAKSAGKNSLRFFNHEMQAIVTEKLELEADLRFSFKQKDFSLHYQPQVNHHGIVTGAEALLRWFHSERGSVSPLEFIPIAEETGLIIPLGCWVIQTACEQLKAWSQSQDTCKLTIAVNVSARQFRNVEFVSQVLDALSETGADPKLLKIELTESLLLENVEDTIKKMTDLKSHGVCFSLDDFGTGYSSLFYLKRLPLDQLKIDRSFVSDVLTDPNDTVIVKTIIALGKSLGLEVIAEGVETSEQRDFLLSNDCNAHQGYFFSKPLPGLLFDEFIKLQNIAEFKLI